MPNKVDSWGLIVSRDAQSPLHSPGPPVSSPASTAGSSPAWSLSLTCT